MSGSKTIIEDDDRLPNVHPGDILREDFMIGSEIPLQEVAADAHVPAAKLRALVASEIDVDADLDLRLSRYFGMSEGFFLRLQIAYDLEEVRRACGDELNSITPRVADAA